MKKLVLFIFIFLFSLQAYATVIPLLWCTGSVGPNNTTTTYAFISASGANSLASESSKQEVMPVAGTIAKLYLDLPTAPGGSASWAITLRDNSSNTSLTCTITGAATNCQDNQHAVTVAVGDLVDYMIVPSGTPASTRFMATVLLYSGRTYQSVLISDTNGNLSNSSTEYTGMMGDSSAVSATESVRQEIVSAPGTIKNFYVATSASPGAGTSYVFTVDKNGVAQSLTCTVSGTNTTCNDTNAAHAFSVAATDLVDISAAPVSSPTAIQAAISMEFDPTTDGQTLIGATLSAVPSTTSTDYGLFQSNGNNINTSEAVVQTAAQVMQIKNLYVSLANAPGTGATYQYALRQNGSTEALSVTLSGVSASGHDTSDTITTAQGDLIDYIIIPTSSPASSGQVYVGWTIYIKPDTFDHLQLSGD